MKNLSIHLLVAACLASALPYAAAQESSGTEKQPSAKPAPKKPAASRKKEKAEPHEDDKVPDVTAARSTDYDCELGRKLTIYRQADDDQHIALRWKKQLLRLSRVPTTTGANRFENRKNGWVWIDIPAKGMLLDALKGQQLANECRDPDQIEALKEDKPAA